MCVFVHVFAAGRTGAGESSGVVKMGVSPPKDEPSPKAAAPEQLQLQLMSMGTERTLLY